MFSDLVEQKTIEFVGGPFDDLLCLIPSFLDGPIAFLTSPLSYYCQQEDGKWHFQPKDEAI